MIRLKIRKISRVKNRIFLVYDNNCPFCKHVAFSLKHLFNVERLAIIPNSSKRAAYLSKKLTRAMLQKNVHVVIKENNSMLVLSGADAVAKILSKKDGFEFLWKIHSTFPFIFRFAYYILKKIKVFFNKFL